MIAIDASIVFKLLVEEKNSEAVAALWDQWTQEGLEIYAPYLLHYEIYGALRVKTYRKQLEEQDQKKILDIYHRLNITFIADNEILPEALGLANRFGLPTIYDSVYLALAQKMALEFWTADHRLFTAVGKQLNFVRKL